MPLLLALLAGCGHVKVDESLSAEEQWAIARSDFEQENYLDAIDVLNVFTLNYSGSALIDSAQFLLGECHFALKEYILAESEYLRLAQNFPQSPLLDDARLKIILCNLYLAPSYSHEQKYTERTAQIAQDFLQDYPASDLSVRLAPQPHTGEVLRQIFTLGIWSPSRKDIAQQPLFDTQVIYPHRGKNFGQWLLNVLSFGFYHPPERRQRLGNGQEVKGDWVAQRALVDSQNRLAQKNYKAAELYYRLGKYPSAVIYCDRVLELYGKTSWAASALRLKGKSRSAMKQH